MAVDSPQAEDSDAATSQEEAGDAVLEDGRGWEALHDYTGDLPPESVEALEAVRELEPLFPLLYSLTGRAPRDFLVRAAAIEALVADGRPTFSSKDLEEVLYWLTPQTRASVLAALRRSGWLHHEPSRGTTVTASGLWVYDVLAFLHKRVREDDLEPTLAGVDYAMEIGLDPLYHLQSMRSRLERLRREMEEARASYSEVVLRDAAEKLEATLALSQQIRRVLERVPLDRKAARHQVREIHDLLSRLHGVGSELQRAISEVGRQYLHLSEGMTVEQIVRALQRIAPDDLAEVGRRALRGVLPRVPLLVTAAVAGAAEEYWAREHLRIEPIPWEEPEPAAAVEEALELPEEVRAFLAELVTLADEAGERGLSELVPREDPSTSYLRTTLLPLVGRDPAGQGVAGQLGALDLAVQVEGDGWPEDLGEGPLRRLSRGRVCGRGTG